jgi:hypothetical protein
VQAIMKIAIRAAVELLKRRIAVTPYSRSLAVSS